MHYSFEKELFEYGGVRYTRCHKRCLDIEDVLRHFVEHLSVNIVLYIREIK